MEFIFYYCKFIIIVWMNAKSRVELENDAELHEMWGKFLV